MEARREENRHSATRSSENMGVLAGKQAGHGFGRSKLSSAYHGVIASYSSGLASDLLKGRIGMADFRKTLSVRKVLMWAMAPAGVLLIIAVVAPIVWSSQAVKRWGSYRREAIKNGKVFDLAPPSPPIPAAQNFAGEDPFRPVKVDLEGKRLEPERLITEWAAKDFMPNLEGGKRADLPGLAEHLKLAAKSDEEVAAAVLRDCDKQLQGKWPTVLAAEAKPLTRFGLSYSPLPVAEKLPGAEMRIAVQIHMTHAVMLLHMKRSADAVREVRGALRIAAAAKTEPNLVAHMWHTAFVALQVEVVWEGLGQGAWSDADLVALEGEFAKLHTSIGYTQALEHERQETNWLFDTILQPGGGGKQALNRWTAGKKDSEGMTRVIMHLPSGVIRDNQLAANLEWDAMERQIDAEGIWRPSAVPYDSEAMHGPDRVRYFLAYIFMPRYAKAEKRVLATEAWIRQARLAIALERFRRAHGSFPDRLDAVVPQYLPAVLADPMDGATMRYGKDSPNRFRLWSVGTNRQDDGGKSDGEFIDGKLDLVWPGTGGGK